MRSGGERVTVRSRMRTKPSVVLAGSILLLAGAGTGAALLLRSKKPARPPDVILVILDTVRKDALSCYGNPRPTTPVIDALAREGALFLCASTTAPWTAPAVASIFTGMLPSEHGLHEEYLNLERDRVTLAERLSAAGYQTKAYSNNPWISPRLGLAQGFDEFDSVWRELETEELAGSEQGGKQTNAKLEKWLATERDPSRPLFLLVHYLEPHLPYQPPAPFDQRFFESKPPPPDETTIARMRELGTPQELGYILRQYELSDEELGVLRTLYEAEVAYTDNLVGELLGLLRARGLLDRALFVLTADHGENLGEHHLLDHKFSLHETLLGVPLIVRFPGTVDPGQRIAEPVQTTDIFATVLDLAGLPGPSPASAHNLFGSRSEERPVFAQHFRATVFMELVRTRFPLVDSRHLLRQLSSVRIGPLKYTWSSTGRGELYDLERDPGELQDLAGERPEMASALEAQIVRLPARK